MKKLTFIISILLVTYCGDRNPANQEVKKMDERLKLYNDVLNELVENHFYDLFLGKENITRLQKSYLLDISNPDTINYNRELRELKTLIKSDTARQLSICFLKDLVMLRNYFQVFTESEILDGKSGSPGFRSDLEEFSPNPSQVLDSLKEIQHQNSYKDFNPQYFKISNNREDCKIGKVGFSKIYFNESHNRAILYYEFVCGEKCGKGEMLTVELDNGKYVIKKRSELWFW